MRAWYADPIVRILLLLGVAFVATLLSLVSFLFYGTGGDPTRLELGLLALAVGLTFYVSVTSGSV